MTDATGTRVRCERCQGHGHTHYGGAYTGSCQECGGTGYVIPNSAASDPCDCPECGGEVEHGARPADATRNRVLDDHALAIRHLIAHYYGPAAYDEAADAAIARLDEVVSPDE